MHPGGPIVMPFAVLIVIGIAAGVVGITGALYAIMGASLPWWTKVFALGLWTMLVGWLAAWAKDHP